MLSDLLKTHGVKQTLEECLVLKNYDKLREIVDSLKEDALLEIVAKLSQDNLKAFINIFPNLIKTNSFVRCADSHVKNKILKSISCDNLQKVLRSLSNDDLYIFMGNISIDNKARIKKCLTMQDNGAIHIKQKYFGHDIGDLVSLNYIIMPSFWSVKKAKEHVAKDQRFYNNNYRVLISNEKCEVIGYIPIHVLLVSKDNLLLNAIVNTNVISKKISEVEGANLSNIVYSTKCDFIVILDVNNKIIGTVSAVDLLVKMQTNVSKDSDSFVSNLSFVDNAAKYFPELFVSFVISSLLYTWCYFYGGANAVLKIYVFPAFVPLSLSYTVYKILSLLKMEQQVLKISIKPLSSAFVNLLIVLGLIFVQVLLCEGISQAQNVVASIAIGAVLSSVMVGLPVMLQRDRMHKNSLTHWRYLFPFSLGVSLLSAVLVCIFF